MSGSQQRNARRKAERERLGREKRTKRRRNVIAGIAILLVGAGAFGVYRTSRADLATQQDEVAGLQSEAAALAAAAAASEAQAAAVAEAAEATGIVPDDPSVEPGTAVDSGLEPFIDDRPVACGSEEPANAGDTRAQYPGGPAEVIEDGVDYVAVIETSCGTVTVDLLESDAPLTANSFVFLAQEGFFDGLEIFRNAVGIGALQTGGGDHTGNWRIGYALSDELGLAESDGYPVGSVAMATVGPNLGGSQFFFVYNGEFDRGFETNRAYAVFGQVQEGLDVVEEISALGLGGVGDTPIERVYMETVTIEER